MSFTTQNSITLSLLFVFAIILGAILFQPRAYEDELAGVVMINRIVAVTEKAIDGVAPEIPPNTPVSTGTGFFIAPNLIVTNNHVAGAYPDPQDNIPALSDVLVIQGKKSGKTYPGYLLASDPLSDIALVRIGDQSASKENDAYWQDYVAKNGYYEFKFADSNLINPGDTIHSIGHPSSLDWTVTEGIVSDPAQRVDVFMNEAKGPVFAIQVDSKIHPGNSGGPSIDDEGEVIGINTLMLTVPGGSYGFAIPSNIVKRVTRDLLASGGKEEINWAALQIGLGKQTITNGLEWPSVASLVQDGAGMKGGLKINDQIMAIRTVPNQWVETKRVDDIMNYMGLAEPKQRVALKLLRDGKEKIIYMDLGSVPSTYYTQQNDPEPNRPGR